MEEFISAKDSKPVFRALWYYDSLPLLRKAY
jgi:hypothetical protein